MTELIFNQQSMIFTILNKFLQVLTQIYIFFINKFKE